MTNRRFEEAISRWVPLSFKAENNRNKSKIKMKNVKLWRPDPSAPLRCAQDDIFVLHRRSGDG
ncbi:MAG: hypothetical protein ACYS6W_08400 [Planctomycetota bacterium]|jgi:hypothetical protein